MKTLRNALAISFLSLVAAIAAGCECSSDEDDPEEACRKITAAVNKVLTGCGQPTESDTSICGVVCAGGILHCSESADVDACASTITSLSCADAQGHTFSNLSACAEVFSTMADSCSSSSADEDDDFDD